MKETRLYNYALLTGATILLGGVFLHSWMAIAIGALVAGVGGVFGMMSTLRR
jgi:hypothetical protein